MPFINMTEDQYRDIQKKSFREMNEFLRGILQKGFDWGMKASEALTDDEMEAAIKKVKGIGESRAKEAVQALKRAALLKESDRLLKLTGGYGRIGGKGHGK